MATRAFENEMGASLQYEKQLPALLRSLKGDQMIFRNWKSSFADYPAVRKGAVVTGTVSTGLDLSEQAQILFDNIVTEQAGIYGRLFNLTTTVGHVEADVENIASKFFYEPIADLVRMAAAFNALKSFVHGVKLKDLTSDLTNFMFVRMLSEVGSFFNQVDRLANLAINPLKASVGRVASLANRVQGIGADSGYVKDGGLKGAVQGNACQKSRAVQAHQVEDHHRETPAEKARGGTAEAAWTKACNVTKGINSLTSHLNWATNEINKRNNTVQESLAKLARRRTSDQSDRIELLCSMQSLDTLINLSTKFASELGINGAPRTATQQVEAMGRILTNLRSPSASVYSIQNGTVQVTPRCFSAPTAQVEKVFAKGGLNRVTSDLMRKVDIGDSLA
jgi:hypothetical protein